MTVAAALSERTFETLKLDITDAVLTITIDRPKALNALSQQVFVDLRQVLTVLREGLGSVSGSEADWSIRGIIITGAGDKSFVAGGDITEMSKMSPADVKQYSGDSQELTLWLEELAVPVVAAVNGFALGGGCELALGCDMIFASETASFGQPEVALGLIPGFGGTVRLQKAVGPQLAADLIYSGRRISAPEAKEIGLVSRIFDSNENLIAGAHEFFATVAKQSPLAVATAKKAVRSVAHLSNAEGLDVELDAFVSCFSTEDMREGTSAFVEKRSANFSGK